MYIYIYVHMVEQGKSNGIFDFTKEHPTLTANLLLSKFYLQVMMSTAASQFVFAMLLTFGVSRSGGSQHFMIREV